MASYIVAGAVHAAETTFNTHKAQRVRPSSVTNTAALKRLTPICDANRHKFADVMATAQQVASLLCGGQGAQQGAK